MNILDRLFSTKINKKELKRNLLVEWALSAKEYIIEHKNIAYGILIGIVVIIIAVPLYISSYNKKVDEASKFFETGLYFYRNAFYNKDLTPDERLNNLKESIKRWEFVVREFSSTPVAKDALFYEAGAYYELGDYNNAIKKYEELYNKDDDYYFIDIVLIDKAKCYEQLNNLQGALASYQKVVEDYPDSAGAPYAQYNIAKIYELSNKLKEALQGYQKVVANYKYSIWAQQSRKRMLFLQTFLVRKPINKKVEKNNNKFEQLPQLPPK